MPPKKPTKKECAKCKNAYTLTAFYSADPTFFEDGKLHICKKCCGVILEEKGFEGFQSLLRMLNKPLYQDLFKGDFGDYIKNVNSLPQYKGVYYNDSDRFKEIKSVENQRKVKPKNISEEELVASQDFWGHGFTELQYIFLNTEYDDYLNRYDVEAKAMEDLIKEICLTRLDIRDRRSEGKDVDKQQKTLQDLLGSSNLKPVQETGANAVEQETFGTLIKKYENERPIPEPDEKWKDVDGIGKYIRVWFLGHLARMTGKENPYQHEYDEEISKYRVEFEEDYEEENQLSEGDD